MPSVYLALEQQKMDIFTFLSILVTFAAVTITYFKWKFQYWYHRNLNFLPPTIPYGNTASPFKRREFIGVRLKRHYDSMKSKGWKHGGLFLFTSPTYLLVDLDYIKNVMTKDFQYFTDRGTYYNEKDDPLSAHLFAIEGQKWRNLRTKLTPTFTSGKMKMMLQTLVDCVPNLLEKIQTDAGNRPIDIKEVLGCFTTDIIGSCAFGLDCNTFKEENSPFRIYGKKTLTMSTSQLLRMIFTMLLPKVAKMLKMTMTPKDVTDFFMKMVKDTIKYRQENNIKRNDFLQLLLDLKSEETLTFNEVAAQCFVFFLAGFETSSTTMTFTLYELARRPDLQEKVRNEIGTTLKKHDGKMTYEAIQDMKYMDQVINEALRMYPPVSFLTRKCVQDYKIPEENVVIEKGISVMIPVYGIHYDPEYYPEPERFDPDRFSEEEKSKRHHYAHIPFGEGPRVCIGMRFGLMQSKVGLACLLKEYKFSVSERTLQPLKMKSSAFVLSAEGEIWLDAEKII